MERFSLLGRINWRRKSCLSKNRKSKNYRLGIKCDRSANVNTWKLSADKETSEHEASLSSTNLDSTLNTTITDSECSDYDVMPLDSSLFSTTPESISIALNSQDCSLNSTKSKLSLQCNGDQPSTNTSHCSDHCCSFTCCHSQSKNVSTQCNIPPSGNTCYYCALHEACMNNNGIVQQIVQHPYFLNSYPLCMIMTKYEISPTLWKLLDLVTCQLRTLLGKVCCTEAYGPHVNPL